MSKNAAARVKADTKVIQSMNLDEGDCPFGDQTWINRKSTIKIGNANAPNTESDKYFVEAHEEETSSSDSEDEKTRTSKLPQSKKFHYQADMKKSVRTGEKLDLPEDVDVILDDMEDDMKLKVIELTREAIEKNPDDDEDGTARAATLKKRLDEVLGVSWMVCVLADKFWAGCSFRPGYTFGFELQDNVYMVWRTPSPNAIK